MSGEYKQVAPAAGALNGLNGPHAETDDWLARFHAGDRALLEQCYHEHVGAVARAVGAVVSGADQETLVHDVFLKLMTDERTRRGFRGGNLGAWISTVARNLAIDFARRAGREQPVEPAEAARLAGGCWDRLETRTEARRLIERFRQEQLPPGWEGVFVTRFIEQRSQRDAACELGIGRTTLAWREMRIRKLLRRFVLGGNGR